MYQFYENENIVSGNETFEIFMKSFKKNKRHNKGEKKSLKKEKKT